MRHVAGHCNTTDMAVGVELVEAEPQWMIRTGKEHRYAIFLAVLTLFSVKILPIVQMP